MSSYWITQRRPDGSERPWCFDRRIDLFATVPERHSAAAMDDERVAERLIDDLVTLVEAGLIEPIESDGTIRFAAVDPDEWDMP
jgi:hypothetical protein